MSDNNQPPEKGKLRACAIGILMFALISYPIARFIGEFQFSEYAAELDAGQYKQIFDPPYHEMLATSTNITFLWVAQDIFAQSDGMWMVAADERVFLTINGTTAYNGKTGQFLWHNDIKPDRLQATENAVYITAKQSFTADPYVEALDVQSGAMLWQGVPLTGIKYISHLRVYDDLVYVATGPVDTYRLYSANTGDLLFVGDDSLRKVQDNRFVVVLPEETIAELPSSYEADYFLWPQVSTDIWQSDELVSNEEITGKIVFGLTQNGSLEGRDLKSGDVIFAVQFSPEKIHRVNWKGVPYPYKVAVDTANNLVYVWLVDSQQLFAFSFLLAA